MDILRLKGDADEELRQTKAEIAKLKDSLSNTPGGSAILASSSSSDLITREDNSKVKQMEAEISELRKQKQLLNEQLEQLKSTSSLTGNQSKEIEELRNQNKLLEEEVQRLNTMSEKSKSVIEQLKVKFDEQRANNIKLAHKIKELQQQGVTPASE